jgi:hypothetical protein
LRWDKDFRTEELKRLEESGVKFDFKDDVWKTYFLDIWELIGAFQPYFKISNDKRRGWIDPQAFQEAKLLGETQTLVIRASWLIPHILLESKDTGFYSQLLLLPQNENDLYKRFGQDPKVIDRFNQLRHGGATVGPSIVAIHNRELQEIPSSFGHDYRFIWRTFDFAKDADDPQRNVLRSLGGTVKHDGREIIGTLPNGLHWYYLSNGAGVQANVVPQDIALDQRDKRGISNPNVINAIKCMDCHTPVSGIYPFKDNVKAAILSPDTALAVIAKDNRIETQFTPVEPANPVIRSGRLKIQLVGAVDEKIRAQVTNRIKDLEEYYLTDLDERITQQQESYGKRVEACTTLKPAELATALVKTYNTYHEDLVTPELAAREMGMPLQVANPLLRASGNQDLILLASGQPIRRAAWERGFGDAARVTVYPWEQLVKPVSHK